MAKNTYKPFFSTIGIVDTGSITLKNWGLFNSLSCPGVNKGCEAVLNSPWGTLIKMINMIYHSHLQAF